MTSGTLRQRQIAETRAALISAGRELFARQGYWAPSANEIAARAELTRGALYHHFPDGKPDLFHAVFTSVQDDIFTAVHAARDAGATWRGELDAYLSACARPEVAQIVLLDGPAVLGAEAWRNADEALWMGVIAEGIAELPPNHPIHRRDPAVVARLLFGAFGEAALAVAAADDPEHMRAEAIETIAAMIGLNE